MAPARQIVIPYAPRKVFFDYHARPQRWAVLVAHRRCGKTVACINDIIAKALQLNQPHGRYAYVAPFLAQAKEVAWEYLKRFALPAIADKNESELWVELLNGARIRIHGADNPDRLRGAYLDGVVMDEYADMRPSVWGEVIRPMLADRRGWGTFIGTPKGRNEFFEIADRAKTDDNWYQTVLRASDTGILPQAELDDARQDMTGEQYEQEFECSFDAAILGAYYGKEIAQAERDGRVVDFDYDPTLPVHTVWDLGKGANMAIWMFQVVVDEIGVIDHFEGSHDEAIPDCVRALSDKPYTWGDDWVPHDAKVKELGTGRTRIETLIALKRKPRLVPDHGVMDGINAGRLTMAKCWFHRTRCAEGLEALRQYRADYDEKLRTFKNEPRHDWCFTADTKVLTRYGTYQIKELPNQGEVLTPCGWKHYHSPRLTRRNAQVVAVRFADGLTVRCTPDHMFKTVNGWKSAESLTRGSVIQSSLTNSRSISTAASTACGQAKDIIRAAARNCIAMFGLARSGQFLAGVISTTGIQTQPTIYSSISNASRPVSIFRSHGKTDERSETPRGTLRKARVTPPLIGTSQMPGAYGIVATLFGRKAGLSGSAKSAPAISAAFYSMLSFGRAAIVRSFAALVARPLVIERVETLSKTEDVYCITVPGEESFSLANGAVVHNCSHSADAFRYLAMAYREITPEKPKAAPRGLVVAGGAPPPGWQLPTYDDLLKRQQDEPRRRERI